MTDTTDTAHREDLSTADLMVRLSQQTSRLVRDEIALAQAEMKEKGKRAGIGLGLFSGAGLLAFYGAAVLIACAVLALAVVLAAWLAALVVGVALLLAAAVAALVGKKQTAQATPAKPVAAVDSVKSDVQAVKESGHR